jgi:hypothetical protein
MERETLAVRARTGEDLGSFTLEEIARRLGDEDRNRVN